MLVDHLGEALLIHVNHVICGTKVKPDDLWECLADAPVRCSDRITYGPLKSYVHKNHLRFGVGIGRRKKGTL